MVITSPTLFARARGGDRFWKRRRILSLSAVRNDFERESHTRFIMGLRTFKPDLTKCIYFWIDFCVLEFANQPQERGNS